VEEIKARPVFKELKVKQVFREKLVHKARQG
jgi:hypothetical protein